MAEILDLIRRKEDWQNKVKNHTIVKRWVKELATQGISEHILTTAIDVLLSDKLGREFDEDGEYHDWPLELSIEAKEIGVDCKCDCLACSEETQHKLMDEDEEAYDHHNWTSHVDQIEENFFDETFIDSKVTEYLGKTCECAKGLYTRHREVRQKFLDQHTVVADGIIPPALLAMFVSECRDLEERIPIDWHPGSGNTVKNLVHPSLGTYIKDLTELSENAKNIPEKLTIFQWLPCDFSVQGNLVRNPVVRINSPINNLSRADLRNAELYRIIEGILGYFIPMFDKVLECNRSDGQRRLPASLSPYRDNLQVIVKISNTQLTPEKPKFDTGSWHLEGLPCENIVATGILYANVENIDNSFLQFRTTLDEAPPYEQGNHRDPELHYGVSEVKDREGFMETTTTSIPLGQYKAQTGRCLVFPNCFQHRIAPFSLTDPEKPGSRETLVFFLINPKKPILSTASVVSSGLTSFAEAVRYRELLMFERKMAVDDQKNYFERGFTLCEH